MTPLNLDPNVNYLAQPNDVDIPEWRKGLAAFGKETKALGAGLVALGAQAAGFEGTRDRALENYQRNMEEAQSGWMTPEVGRIEDIQDAGDFGKWLGYQVPKGLAQLGMIVGTGGVTGSVAKLTAKKAVKEMAKEGTERLAAAAAQRGVAAEVLQTGAQKQLAQRTMRGVQAGALGSALGMETGFMYGKLANDKSIGPEAAVGPSLTYGGVAAALEYLPVHVAGKAIGLNRALFRDVIKRDPGLAAQARELSKKQKALKAGGQVGKAMAGGAAIEGITEGMQNLAEQAATKYAQQDPEWASVLPTTKEGWSEFWNSVAVGAAVGGAAGGALGSFTGKAHGAEATSAQDAVPQPVGEPIAAPVAEQPVVTAQPEAQVSDGVVPPDAVAQPIDATQPQTDVLAEAPSARQPAIGEQPGLQAPDVIAEPAAQTTAPQGQTDNIVPLPQQEGYDRWAQTTLDTQAAQAGLAEQANQAAWGDVVDPAATPQEAPTIPEATNAQQDTQASSVYGDVQGTQQVGREEVQLSTEASSNGVLQEGQGVQEEVVATISKADGKPFASHAAATRRMNQMWDAGELTIEGGKEAGRQARARVRREGDGYVIDKLESRELVAPVPDTDSTGQPVHSTPEGRDNFKQWFAGSKVTDGEGRPLVMYHGTGQDFLEFKPSAQANGLLFFTESPQTASEYADNTRTGYSNIAQAEDRVNLQFVAEGYPEFFDGKHLQAQLDSNSVIEVLFNSNVSAAEQLGEQLENGDISVKDAIAGFNTIVDTLNQGGSVMPVYLNAKNIAGSRENPIPWRDAERIGADKLRAEGYDGIWVTEGTEVALAVVDKQQIKSAIGNRGTFEQGNPNILESRASVPTYTAIDFVAATDAVLGQGWTQRAIDAGILQVNETSEPGSASGTFRQSTGQLTINLDRTPRGQSAVSVLLHEASHAGMEKMLGAQFAEFHADLQRLAEQGSYTAKMAMTQATDALIRSINASRKAAGLEPFPHRLDGSLKGEELATEIKRVRELIESKHPGLLREEDMAYYVQLASNAKPAEVGYWKRLKLAIQAWFASTGFGQALAGLGWRPEMSPQLAVALAKQSAKQTLARAEAVNEAVARQEMKLKKLPAAVRLAMMESRVWHAGPTPWAPEPGFPRGRPRLDKVGTGEGGQLFGWGWYSAENEKVSGPEGQYAKIFSGGHSLPRYAKPSDFTVEGAGLTDLQVKTIKEEARMLFNSSGSLQEAHEKLTPERIIQRSAKLDRRSIKNLSSSDFTIKVTAKDLANRPATAVVYRLDIPDADIQRMLQWEKPLSEQTSEVQAALKRTIQYDPMQKEAYLVRTEVPGGTPYTLVSGVGGTREEAVDNLLKSYTASSLYDALSNELPSASNEHPKKKVSEYFRSLGITGNKYLDAGSRIDGEGTYNYVVWDQDVLDRVGEQHFDHQTDMLLESRDFTEAEIADTLNSLPFNLRVPETWFTDPTSPAIEDVREPGKGNKIFHALVDRFEYVRGKSSDLYRTFDEWKNRQGALMAEVDRQFVDPMRRMVSRYKPGADDARPIQLMRNEYEGEPLDKPVPVVELVGHQLAARHVVEDNVNDKLATRAAPTFLKELKKQLTPHQVGLLNADILLETGDSTAVDKLSEQQARAIFEKHLPSANPTSDIGQRWELFKRRSSGYSTATPGSAAAMEDLLAGFANAHEIYTPQVAGRQSFQEIAELSDKLAAHQRALRVEGGLIDQAQADRLEAAYAHYVPMRREAFDYDKELADIFERPASHTGKLLTRKGSEVSGYGTAVHVLQNHLAQGFTAAAAAARNQMMNKFADELYANKEAWKDWFRFSDKHENNGAMGLVRGGKELFIIPAAKNMRAAAIARVITGMDAQQLAGPLKIMQGINSWIRWTNVSASPAFMLTNVPRDYLTARYNLLASDAAEYAKEIGSWKNYKESFRALHKVIVQGVRETTDHKVQEWIDLVEDFEKAGGKTSFVEALKAMDGDSWKSFEAQVGRRQGKSRAVLEFGLRQLETLENLNIVLENTMRLSAFKVMRDKVGTERAAEIARNLTTNFTRRGAHVDAINTWWLFYNATVQGNWQVVQNLLLNPNKAGARRLQKAVAGTVLFAFIIDQLGRALSDDEDKDGVSDWDSVPEYEKERKIRLPVKIGGAYPSIPAPWVFNVFWRMGGMLGEVKDGVLKPQDAVLDSIGLVASAMDPVGATKGSLAQAVSPSAFDPFMQIIENKDFVGNPLGPDGYPGASKRPDAYLTWDSTPGKYKHAAEFINSLTGGNEVESGSMDFRPSTYETLANFLMGSLGRLVLEDLPELGMSPFTDKKEFETWSNAPIAKVFGAAPSDGTAVSLYHDRVAQVLGAKRLVKEYSEGPNRDPKKLAEVRRDRAALLRMVPQVEDVERQIKNLRKAKRSAQARGDSRMEEVLRDRIVQIQKRLNSSFARRVGN